MTSSRRSSRRVASSTATCSSASSRAHVGSSLAASRDSSLSSSFSDNLNEGATEDSHDATEDAAMLTGWSTHTSASYHHFTPDEASEIRAALLVWYRANRRKLPWRGDPPPFDGSTAGINGNGNNNNAKSVKKKKKAIKSKPSDEKEQPTISEYFGAQTTSATSKTKTSGRSKGKLSSDKSEGIRMDAPEITQPLELHGNNAIPQSAYGIWVSEIMLQQTRVEAVIPYYAQWMTSFPTVQSLAGATEEQVNSHWAGLGFYRRARMLHRGAQRVVEEYGGRVPESVAELVKIEGVGRYTAGAISSIAYGKCEPVVDGNVCRVLARLTGIANHIKAPILKDRIGWDLARQLVEADGGTCAGEVNQALMELGATYCAPGGSGLDGRDPLREYYRSTKIGRAVWERHMKDKNWDMEEFVSVTSAARGGRRCPLCDVEDGISNVLFDISQKIEDGSIQSSISADEAATIGHSAFPTAPPKKDKREEVLAVAALKHVSSEGVDRWLMVKRPKTGLLAGQWEFASVCVWNSAESKGNSGKGKGTKKKGVVPLIKPSVRREALDVFLSGIESNDISFGERTIVNKEPINHIFSHVRHSMFLEYGKVEIADIECFGGTTHDNRDVRFMSEEEMDGVGVTSGVKKIIRAVKASNVATSKASASGLARKRRRKS